MGISEYVSERVYDDARPVSPSHLEMIKRAYWQQILEDWPRDPQNSSRYLCERGKPMPKGAPGLWSHTNVANNGSSYDGCCDEYKCLDCQYEWSVEVPQ